MLGNKGPRSKASRPFVTLTRYIRYNQLMKRNIVIVVLLIITLIIGFVIGRETATIKNPLSNSNSKPVIEKVDTATASSSSQSTSTDSVEGPTFDSSDITPEQRELLGTFGIDADAVVVTATMITCAETKIGKARLEEIFSGATPTFFEGVDLFSCYQP